MVRLIVTEEAKMPTTNGTRNRVQFNTSSKATAYTFGVEIECYVPRGSFPVGGYHSGTSLEGFGFPTGWNAQRDGSLHSAPRGYEGAEIVSPVLHGTDGIMEVLSVMRKLKNDFRAKVRTTCGFHVHVGLASFVDMNARATDVLASVGDVVTVTGQSEDGLLATTGTRSRIDGHAAQDYCASIKRYVANADVRSKTGKATMVEHMSARMVTLNVTNIRGLRNGVVARNRPTVEFRLFAGTLNTVKAAAYIQLALGMVELATTTRTYRSGGLAATRRNDGGRGYGRQGATFTKALEQVLARVRWISKGRSRIEDGVRQMDMLGWILPERGVRGASPSRKVVVREMRRLAKKLDEANVRPTGTF